MELYNSIIKIVIIHCRILLDYPLSNFNTLDGWMGKLQFSWVRFIPGVFPYLREKLQWKMLVHLCIHFGFLCFMVASPTAISIVNLLRDGTVIFQHAFHCNGMACSSAWPWKCNQVQVYLWWNIITMHIDTWIHPLFFLVFISILKC